MYIMLATFVDIFVGYCSGVGGPLLAGLEGKVPFWKQALEEALSFTELRCTTVIISITHVRATSYDGRLYAVAEVSFVFKNCFTTAGFN